jgi:hypothetical protein
MQNSSQGQTVGELGVTHIEKWELATAELLRDATRSDRQIAAALRLSASFVGKVRKKLEQDGKLRPGKRLGGDGKRRRPPRYLTARREKLVAVLQEGCKDERAAANMAAVVRGMSTREVDAVLGDP